VQAHCLVARSWRPVRPVMLLLHERGSSESRCASRRRGVGGVALCSVF
jgi:hypothetical protein